ncbi:hypothetical protein RND71_001081 [Anisodus tanguticus]|uniref:Bifunctional inhibitor/plant lipid transfer protein/seed storage helical domain-containing protein n=1 Tax=Anisodus tanguticus TaxID=243964 RepID=A0AAE1T064_9SOLA|nr:hypothetical protein RND71_001081 [Anisodus tanguticus]
MTKYKKLQSLSEEKETTAKLFYTLIILLVVLSTPITAEPMCDIVPKRLAPCLSYIKGKYDSIKPSNRCCRGLTDIVQMEKTGRKSQEGPYSCLQVHKKALLHISYDPNRIKPASQQCNTWFALPPIGHTTNCS